MRMALKRIGNDERHKFIGTFEKYGYKKAMYGYRKTILLINIRDENENYLCDHLWFNETKGFANIDLKKGDNVSFNGRVSPYVKGYFGYDIDGSPIELDYKIEYPTRIKIVSGLKNVKKFKTKKSKRFSHKFAKKVYLL